MKLRTGISLFMCQGAARIVEPYAPLDVSAQQTVLVLGTAHHPVVGGLCMVSERLPGRQAIGRGLAVSR